MATQLHLQSVQFVNQVHRYQSMKYWEFLVTADALLRAVLIFREVDSTANQAAINLPIANAFREWRSPIRTHAHRHHEPQQWLEHRLQEFLSKKRLLRLSRYPAQEQCSMRH